jgi:hypothetical protein
MSVFHEIGETFARLRPRISSDGRLPPWLSIVFVIVLSALCWAAVIALIVALRRLL